MRNLQGEYRQYLILINLFLLLSFLVSLTILAETPPEKDQYGGTVIIGMKGDFDSFNELNASDSDALHVIQNMLFMSLTRLDSNLQFIPYLADSWEWDL